MSAVAPHILSGAAALLEQLPYESVTEFIRLAGQRVTTGGLTLRADRERPVGEPVEFELRLANGRPALKGSGQVRWCGRDATGELLLGIRFGALDAESRRLVDLLMVTRGAGGRSPEPPPPPVAAPRTVAPPPKHGLPSVAPAIAPLTSAELGGVPRVTGAPAGGFTYSPAKTDQADPEALRTGVIRAAKRPAAGPPKSEWFAEPVTPAPSAGTRKSPNPFAPPPRTERAPDLLASPFGFAAPAPTNEASGVKQDAVPPPQGHRQAQSEVEAPAPATPASDGWMDLSFETTKDVAPEPRPPPVVDAAPPPAPPPPLEAPKLDAAEPLTPTRAGLGGASKGLEALRVSRAIEALRAKEFEKAEAQLQQAIAENPTGARLRYELGLVYFEWSDARSRDHDGAAEAAFSRAAELDPTHDQALVHLGQVQLRRRLFSEAGRSFEEALRRNPHARGATDGLRLLRGRKLRRSLARAGLGLAAVASLAVPALLLLGRAPAAQPAPELAGETRAAPVAAATLAPAPQPTTPPTAPERTPALIEAPNPSPALVAAAPASAAPAAPSEPAATPRASAPRPATTRQARGTTPPPAHVAAGGGASALAKQGDAALRAGKVDEALAFFQKALAADPKFAAAHRGLGSVFVMQGKDAEAIAAYKRYLALAPTAADAGRIRALISGME